MPEMTPTPAQLRGIARAAGGDDSTAAMTAAVDAAIRKRALIAPAAARLARRMRVAAAVLDRGLVDGSPTWVRLAAHRARGGSFPGDAAMRSP